MAEDFKNQVAQYYGQKIAQHGTQPAGVDWNSVPSQEGRFFQLARILPAADFHLLDFGCGYGALYPYLKDRGQVFEYTGFDISPEMLAQAKQYLPADDSVHLVDQLNGFSFDFAIANGVFSVKLGADDASWEAWIKQQLDTLDRHTTQGFSFNLMTRLCDADRMTDKLYYADPGHWLNYCLDRFSDKVELVHGYGLYEFTLMVRKV